MSGASGDGGPSASTRGKPIWMLFFNDGSVIVGGVPRVGGNCVGESHRTGRPDAATQFPHHRALREHVNRTSLWETVSAA